MRRVFLALALLCSLVTFATPASAAPVGASTVHTYRVTLASMSNPAPRQNSTETVRARLTDNGKPVSGALMQTTWHYKTTTSYCSGVTLASGTASCSRRISRATHGYTVYVDIKFVKGGKVLATTRTSFRTQ